MNATSKIFLDKPEKHGITGVKFGNLPPIKERWLEDMLLEMSRLNGPPTTDLPHSVAFYARSLIRERFGIVLPVRKVERMLIEEGIL